MHWIGRGRTRLFRHQPGYYKRLLLWRLSRGSREHIGRRASIFCFRENANSWNERWRTKSRVLLRLKWALKLTHNAQKWFMRLNCRSPRHLISPTFELGRCGFIVDTTINPDRTEPKKSRKKFSMSLEVTSKKNDVLAITLVTTYQRRHIGHIGTERPDDPRPNLI